MLSHRNLLSNSLLLRDFWGFTGDDVLLHALPIYHTHGLFVASNIMALAGGSMIFLPRFTATAVLDALPRATTMMGVPTFYTRLVQEPRFNRGTTAHLRLMISGSAPLLAQTHAEVEALTGHRVLERYGMTETNMNTSNPVDGARIAGTVGLPLPGVDLRITDPKTGTVLPVGEIGMIEVRGENVFRGYWRQPEKTAAEFRADGFFITGDLGVIRDNGYVTIVGRGKDLIITGGFNVYPKEVEAVIDALPGVIESAVIGLQHPDFGEGVTAVVVCEPDAGLSEKGIIAALETQLAAFKRPKRVLMVESLPRNAMGKVQKAQLRDRHAGLFSR
jgi:malonyl-CoA/methylmalonyl-CoA synthetase